ncbi:MAG: hypothetical protein K2J40_00240 [Ruminococcus sp.]|nr:hypothetical protein [Ruminococcus sp.]
MLKKSTVAVMTALTTMLSALTPAAVYAESSAPENTIPERTFSEEFTPYATAPVAYSAEPVQTTTAYNPTSQTVQTTVANTIPEREYYYTTVTYPKDIPDIFPISGKRNITVEAVDRETGEHVDGVQIHLVETEGVFSSSIKRDFGTWNTSDSETYVIPDIEYTLDDIYSMFVMTAVIENLPPDYSVTTNVLDYTIDSGERHWQEVYYDSDTFTIILDKEYHNTFNASCSVIDSTTGKQIQGVEATLYEKTNTVPSKQIETWITSGEDPHIINDIDYSFSIIKPYSDFYLWANLPSGYKIDERKSTWSSSISISDDFEGTAELTIYAVPETNSVTCWLCDKEISKDDAVNTPIGVWLCQECNDKGIIGTTTTTTRTIIYDYSTTTTAQSTVTQTTVRPDTSTIPQYTTQTTVAEIRACYHCGKEINVSDGVITPLGIFLCKECRSMGIGGTTTSAYTNTTQTTQTTVSTPYDFFKDVTTTTRNDTTDLLRKNGFFTAECAAYDSKTGELLPDVELAFVEDNEREIIEMWDSGSETHSIDIRYFLTGMFQPTEKNYRLIAYGLPDGYALDKNNFGNMTELRVTTDNPAENTIQFKVYAYKQDSEINTSGGKIIYGDANCDNKVGLADAILIMQVLSNPDEYKLTEWGIINADVCNRGDGITPQDAVVIQEIDLQLLSIDDLPVKR